MIIYVCFECRGDSYSNPHREAIKLFGREKDAQAWCHQTPVTDFKWREYDEYEVEGVE